MEFQTRLRNVGHLCRKVTSAGSANSAQDQIPSLSPSWALRSLLPPAEHEQWVSSSPRGSWLVRRGGSQIPPGGLSALPLTQHRARGWVSSTLLGTRCSDLQQTSDREGAGTTECPPVLPGKVWWRALCRLPGSLHR